MTSVAAANVVIDHVIGGRIVRGADIEYRSRDRGATLRTPPIDVGALASPRSVPPPAADVPLGDVVEFLSAVGDRLVLADNQHLQQAVDTLVPLSTAPRRIIEQEYIGIARAFGPEVLRGQLATIDAAALDGWRLVPTANGRPSRVRAYPPRLVHLLAGNSPSVAAMTIVWTALLKGVGLLKMPSNDPCTAVAILKTMVDVDPDHPVLRSFSAVYWRGGATEIEAVLLRPQYFDKLVAWGGDAALLHAKQYIGPGLELVAFDPKSSISLIGREAFVSDEALQRAVDAAATDTTLLNQDACASSRHHYVEGSVEEVDRYCEALLPALGVERPMATASGDPPPNELRDEVDVLRELAPDYRVWGDYSGAGLVVRSDSPISSYPDKRTVNVVPVASLAQAATHANVATQTVGVFPAERSGEVRDILAARGVQRVVTLGEAGYMEMLLGLPHDGMYVLPRLARWVVEQGTPSTAELIDRAPAS
jgi:Acyl-CoA reductase (LuxC)